MKFSKEFNQTRKGIMLLPIPIKKGKDRRKTLSRKKFKQIGKYAFLLINICLAFILLYVLSFFTLFHCALKWIECGGVFGNFIAICIQIFPTHVFLTISLFLFGNFHEYLNIKFLDFNGEKFKSNFQKRTRALERVMINFRDFYSIIFSYHFILRLLLH
jgi:hypothetical protein